jgi:hypothetical protein
MKFLFYGSFDILITLSYRYCIRVRDSVYYHTNLPKRPQMFTMLHVVKFQKTTSFVDVKLINIKSKGKGKVHPRTGHEGPGVE